VELADFSNHTRKNLEREKHVKNARLLLTNISHTNAYTHDHGLPHLAAACADGEPMGQ